MIHRRMCQEAGPGTQPPAPCPLVNSPRHPPHPVGRILDAYYLKTQMRISSVDGGAAAPDALWNVIFDDAVPRAGRAPWGSSGSACPEVCWESRPGGETFLLSPSRRVPLRRHPPCPSETLSIQGQRGVDVFRPADDAAFERVQARRLEAELDERLARGGRANPRLMNSSLLLIGW